MVWWLLIFLLVLVKRAVQVRKWTHRFQPRKTANSGDLHIILVPSGFFFFTLGWFNHFLFHPSVLSLKAKLLFPFLLRLLLIFKIMFNFPFLAFLPLLFFPFLYVFLLHFLYPCSHTLPIKLLKIRYTEILISKILATTRRALWTLLSTSVHGWPTQSPIIIVLL